MCQKDSDNPVNMLEYVYLNGCNACKMAFPGIDCTKCKAGRYYRKLSDLLNKYEDEKSR